MKRFILTLCVLSISILVFAYPADVEIISNRDYFPALVEEIKTAQDSIHVVMFSAGYYPEYSDDLNSALYRHLGLAVKRGVKVIVILDSSDWNRGTTMKNKMVADVLREKGVEVYFDPPDITTHCKLIIIDGKTVIVGSTNWTYYALARNNEASVLIRSPGLAKEFEEYFRMILKHSTPDLRIKFKEEK